ncbi:MAG: hypothetical protein CL760_06245 [Chloroflexi bacterium]|nr:hypothetical protein [Chloroflexota bacterium]|tara:strand:- start:44330 stop:45637 length:1308 start_codon:yes stop_codon:yes gene_type:complete
MSNKLSININKKLDEIYELLGLYIVEKDRRLETSKKIQTKKSQLKKSTINLFSIKYTIEEMLIHRIKNLDIILEKVKSEKPELLNEIIKEKLKKCYLRISINDVNLYGTDSTNNIFKYALELLLYKSLDEEEIIDFFEESADHLEAATPSIYFLFISKEKFNYILGLNERKGYVFQSGSSMWRYYYGQPMLNMKIIELLEHTYLNWKFESACKSSIECLKEFNSKRHMKKEKEDTVIYSSFGAGSLKSSNLFGQMTVYKNRNAIVLNTDSFALSSRDCKFERDFLSTILRKIESFRKPEEKDIKFYVNQKRKIIKTGFLNKDIKNGDLVGSSASCSDLIFDIDKAEMESEIVRKRFDKYLLNEDLESIRMRKDLNVEQCFDLLKLNKTIKKRGLGFFTVFIKFIETQNAIELYYNKEEKIFTENFLDMIELQYSI